MPDWRAEVRRRAPPDVPPEREADAVEEMALHLADRYRELRDGGADEAAATRAALSELDACGEPPPRRARARSRRRWAMLDDLWQDARHGLRLMKRAPGFSAVAVLTLALGIGANTAVFSLVDAVLLQPLPFPDAERLVAVTEGAPSLGFPVLPFSAPDFLDYARMQRSFEVLGAYTVGEHDLAGGAEPVRVRSAALTPGVFRALNVPPALGRTFTDEEDRSRSRVVVLGDRLWRRHFAGSPAVLGTRVLVDREPYTVVGVMPAGFEFPLRGPRINGASAEMWVPAAWTSDQASERGSQCNYTAVGRLVPGATPESAAA
jgi:putative ABC transport system permease protein